MPEGGGGDDGGTTRVGIPAVPRSARLVRILAADLGSRAGLRIDEIDELRIAVDEAFFALVAAAAPGTGLEIEGRWSEGDVRLELGVALGADELSVAPMAATLLSALVDEHAHRLDGGRATFHLRKRREE